MNELNLQITGVTEYEDIRQDLTKWDEAMNSFISWFSCAKIEYKELEKTLSSATFELKYPRIEKEINLLVSKTDVLHPKSLIDHVQPIFDKISQITEAVLEYRRQCSELLNLPDRHNSHSTAKSVESKLAQIPNICVTDIDMVLRTSLPKIKENIDRVFSAFYAEKKQVQMLQNEARKIQNRVESHKNHQNYFGLHELCKRAFDLAARILSSPDYSDLDSEKAKLELANSAIEHCEELFKKDLDKINTLWGNVEDYNLWREDYDTIEYNVGQATMDIYSFPKQSKDIESAIIAAKSAKEEQITSLLSKYSDSVQELVSNEISYLKEKCVSKNKLSDLKLSLERAKKTHYIMIAKRVGIGAVAVALIIVNTLGIWWVYVIEAVIVAGGCYLYFKD